MFRNYLKTALRNIRKNKLISFINLTGLSLALGCCITVYTFLEFAYTQDSFHEDKDKIYLVTNTVNRDGNIQHWGDSPTPIGPMLMDDYTQVNAMTRIDYRNGVMKYEDDLFNENFGFVDPDYFEMFTFPLKWGNTESFKEGTGIVITEDISEKYFGTENPVGEQITMIIGQNTLSFTVGGVFEKIPRYASFYVRIAVPFEKIKQADTEYDYDDWKDFISATFIRLNDSADRGTIEAGMNKYVSLQNKAEKDWPAEDYPLEVLETLSQHSEDLQGDISGGSDRAGNMVMFLLGLFMLLLASFNYINTSISSGAKRLKEIGIRKVVGGVKQQLVFQFITENLIMTIIALIVGLILSATLFTPGFDSMFSIGLQVDFTSTGLWVFFLAIVVLTGVASGAYPAFYIASFKPVMIFRGRQKISRNRFTKVFLTFQFILSLILISAGFAFIQNSQFQAKRDWGYNQEQVLVLPLVESADYAPLRNEIAQSPDVKMIAGSSNHAGRSTSLAVIDVAGEQKEVRRLDVGENYPELMELRLIEGRFLNHESVQDQESFVVVNETFIKGLELEEGYDQFTFRYDSNQYSIAGVVEDFHYNHFYDKISPLIIRVVPEEDYRFLSVRTEAGKANSTYETIEASWKEQFPDNPFLGFYQDEIWSWYFNNLRGHGKIMGFMAILSIVLSCMGLFGLVSQNVTFRIKEFSVRKVLGADTMHITKVMNRQFVILLTIAAVIGVPLSFFAISGLMDSIYTYRMPDTPLPYIMAAVILFATSIGTISSLIIKVLRNNPAQTLRTE